MSTTDSERAAFKQACADISAIASLVGFEKYPGIDALLSRVTDLLLMAKPSAALAANAPAAPTAVLADLVAAATRLEALGWFRPTICAAGNANNAMSAMRAALAAAMAQAAAPVVLPETEPSPTAGMNMAQRILHVGGRNPPGSTYVEFGSIQAVEALVRQVLRDLQTSAPVAATQPMVDMVPPATSRDHWMYEQGRLAERDPRTPEAAPAASATHPPIPPAIFITLMRDDSGDMPVFCLMAAYRTTEDVTAARDMLLRRTKGGV